ncbi:MAG: hypothetical protein N4J56_001949 [Chroococcidiopsis sp. SAG 2025]|uniref:hypothetical protein n=1 Tax=Chroococcidiopsis sp. SAG 2025 TaxID=171389 RepID=UPI002936E84D|nr:hypothetical protein [Chroococcidiopsis sp. SAG 2025]MDV2992295.1 hypothetical protein [Chroococcidiopsis sp. SAG 2025]
MLISCQKITTDIEENELCTTEENTAPYVISSTLELALTGNIGHLKQVVLNGHSVLWYALNYQMEREEEIAGDDRWESKSLEEHCDIIESHYLTKREMQKEMDDWFALKNTSKLTPEFIDRFCAASLLGGKGILDS